MGWYTDWFVADKSEARKIASIATTEEYGFDDWPHLSIKNIGVIEFEQLGAIIQEMKFSVDYSIVGELLLSESEEGPFVWEVQSSFIEALANIRPDRIADYAKEWRTAEELSSFHLEDLVNIISELATFSRQAINERKPVLELAVL